MCKFVLTAAAAALSIASIAHAQTARLDVQVSSDNVAWSDTVFAPAGSTVYVRVVATTDMANAVGLASLIYQPTLSNWTSADTRLPFNNATSGGASTNNSGLPANLGRMSPYGQASMTSTSTPGVPTSFIDGSTLRIAGSRATTLTTSADFGIWSTQGPRVSYPSYNQSNTAVIFRYAVTFGPNPALRTLVADIPLAGIKGGRVGWYTSLTSTSGNVVYVNLTQADIDPATINVGPPNAIPVANADAFNMLEDQSLVVTTGSVLNNDTDADANEVLTAELVTTTANGSLSFNENGTFSYVPNADYNGTETFTYRVRDRLGARSNIATVTINVADVNDAPVFNAADPSATTEDSGPRVVTNWATFNPGNGEAQGVAEYEVMGLGNVPLFAAGGWPQVQPNGTLRYTPAPNMSGTSTFEVRVRDNGGTDHGGNDMSEPQVFMITVLPVNDPPTLTLGSVSAVREDSGQRSIPGWAQFEPGPGEQDQVLLGYSVGNVSNPSLFSLLPTVAPDGTLVYTPAPNAVGTSTFTVTARDSGGIANGGIDTSVPQTVTITVTPVNDAPTFSASNPATVLEDSGARSINGWATFNSGGGAAEASQAVAAYIVSGVSNPGLFAAGPAVSNAGALTYTPAAHAFGSATFTVQVRDNGGVEDGGIDTSVGQTFTITVDGVNDAPSFTAPATTTSNEDGGPQVLPGWAQFNAGPGESSQAVAAYTVSNLTNSTLFTVAPSVAPDGTLSYTTAPNVSGSASFQLRVRDNGGTLNGGIDTSGAQTLTISVNPVNDAPTVSLGSLPTVLEDAGPQSVAGFASFNAGPGEGSQSLLGYTVIDVSNPAMFSVQPSVSNAGTLTYTLAPNASGSVTFSVVARDNGGTANGGTDTSAPVLATLNVAAVNDAPTFVASSPAAVDEDSGPQTIAGWAAFNPGPGEAGQVVLAYTVSNLSNASLFSATPAVALDGTLSFTPAANASGSATFQLRVRDNGGVANGGTDTSGAQTFTITVNPVNDAPTVSLGSIPTIIEDGGAQTVTNFASFNAGPGESSQTLLGYTVSDVSNPAMFAAGPSVSNAGTLTYTPSANASGSVTFSVRARDNGGTANGGTDTSAPVFATINITNVNDAPSFAAANPAASLEDAGVVSIAGWAAFNPGPFESGQTAEFQVTAIGNTSLFAAVPSVAPDGTLSYTAAANASGTSSFTVRVRDNGGTASGGQDLSPPQTFTISVTAVNDPPTVTLNSIPVIEEDSPAQVVSGFATFAPGPGEAGQTLVEYLVSEISNPAAFTVPPSVGLNGALSYTPAPDASGVITFKVRARDNGGTQNGGLDLSLPVTATMTINGINDAPVALARDVVIDARSGCPSLGVTPDQVNNGSYDPDNGPAELTIRINRTGEFPVGVTPVILTVTDPDGLSSTSQATVTVLASDSNHNQIPDSCDLIRGGTGPDCDGDGDSDESGCIWDNGGAVASQSPPEGQLSQYGGTIAARVAEDFYLAPGLLYRLTSLRGQILTNSIERTARVQFFHDCDGVPNLEPFASYETTSVASETDGGNGKTLVTYVFEFCDDKLVLDGGKAYWISLQGKVNCNVTDQAYWASVGLQADPRRQLGAVPYKALGIGDHPCTVSGYEDWETIADCCIGCAAMSYLITGHACQLIWDNGAVDLGPTRGGDPSGINRGVFSRAADDIVVKPCRTETICWIEAYIWTNCTPVFGFLELYGDTCRFPTAPNVAPIHRITPTDIVEFDEHITVEGRDYRLVKLEFWNVPWTLQGGRNYWISVGADGAGSFNARSFFAWSEPVSPCGCREVHFNKGAKLGNRQSDFRWTRADREYAFRIATKPFWTDPVQTTIPPSRVCPVDMNEDYQVTIQDLFSFLQAWFSACP